MANTNINRSNINDIVAECIEAVNRELSNQGITLKDSHDAGEFWTHISEKSKEIAYYAFKDYYRGKEEA